MNIWTSSTAHILPVQRTKTFENGGKSAKWDEHFRIPIKDLETEYFYIEVMDTNDFTADRLIGNANLLQCHYTLCVHAFTLSYCIHLKSFEVIFFTLYLRL
jgi:Ca2+-dependent lipid-binding protein